MTDNIELGERLRDFLIQHKERKFTRDEMWAEAFASDPIALATPSDTQRRVIGRARQAAERIGGYITHAVAANGYTYTWTEQTENGVDPMLHYTRIVGGNRAVLDGIKKFVTEAKKLRRPGRDEELDLILQLAKNAEDACMNAEASSQAMTQFLIKRRREDRQASVS